MHPSGLSFPCRRLVSALSLSFVILLNTSCEQVDVTAVPAVRVEISPAEPVVAPGASAQLYAEVLGSDDRVLSGRRITWSSDDESIATVTGDGLVEGVAQGSTVIRAHSEGATGTATVRITTAPSISLTPGSVEFSSAAGGTAPGDRTVSVANAGGGTIGGLSASVRYSGGQPSGWLTARLSGSTAPASLVLSAAQGNLPAGTYNATVEVTSTTAGTSPKVVTVVLRVLAPAPALRVSATAVSFTASVGGANPAPLTLTVSNAGGGTLSSLSVSILGEGSTWLSAELAGTTAPTTLTLRAQLASLAAGTYNATVRVAAANAGNSPVDVPVTLTVTAGEPDEAPERPDDLSATARSDRRIDLSWDDESDDETEFQIRRAGGGADWATIGQTVANQTSFTDTSGLVGSTSYQYAVRACRGSSCSAWSSPASATTAPTAPTNATATASSEGIDVTWQDNSSDETAFSVQRSANSSSWQVVATVSANAESYSDRSVQAGTTYRYRIAACRGSLCSTYSNEAHAEATTPSGTPSMPGAFTGKAVSTSQIDLSWQAPGGQTGYELRWRKDAKGAWNTRTIDGAATSYSHTNLASDTDYEYQLRACAGSSCSGWTARIVVTTLDD